MTLHPDTHHVAERHHLCIRHSELFGDILEFFLGYVHGDRDGLTTRGFREGVAPKFSRFVTIGRWSQADSGNELCLMRYYFASAYPVDAQEKAFYLVRPGANRAGRDLCKTPEGTGANAADHEPKSRFSDSAPGRGGCFKYICPNDAIPGRTL